MKAKKTRNFVERRFFETLNNDYEEIEKELDEIERLAEIGKYTEMAFKKDYPELNFGVDSFEDEDEEVECEEGNIVINSIEELIKWGKEQEK